MTQGTCQCWRHFPGTLGTDQGRECSIELVVDFSVSAIFHSVSPCLRVRPFFLAKIRGKGMSYPLTDS